MRYRALARKRDKKRELASFIQRGEQVRVQERRDVADSKTKSHCRRLRCCVCRQREAEEESCRSDAKMPVYLLLLCISTFS
ncbi:hypothetical protein EUGRSUZ_G00702 [Eucalyptus grandis]|uniref:Uncharacterized protein n=2 Tax=Eucalyptus grandis TaxID=71139 RepID=A0A059BBP3_EUCGR|nr:hypothetical protein EUGRSUZ_G00702 [Eucalyptus grandis]